MLHLHIFIHIDGAFDWIVTLAGWASVLVVSGPRRTLRRLYRKE